MLNCTLLLDSASRFGLGKGNKNFRRDAKIAQFLVPLVVF